MIASFALQQNRKIELVNGLVEAYSVLVYCPLSSQCVSGVVLPGLRHLEILVNQCLPQQKDAVRSLLKEIESRQDLSKPIERYMKIIIGIINRYIYFCYNVFIKIIFVFQDSLDEFRAFVIHGNGERRSRCRGYAPKNEQDLSTENRNARYAEYFPQEIDSWQEIQRIKDIKFIASVSPRFYVVEYSGEQSQGCC